MSKVTDKDIIDRDDANVSDETIINRDDSDLSDEEVLNLPYNMWMRKN